MLNEEEQEPFRTIKLTIEYDGTHFSGWQIQPRKRTVQGEIEKALFCLTQQRIKITGAGRTDAGVHALGMVASLRCSNHLPLSAFEQGMNNLLPEDIRINKAEDVDSSFNARKSAVSRTYRYVLYRTKRVIGRQYGWWPKREFSVEPMKEASKYLIGGHRWNAFAKSNEVTDDFFSQVLDIRWHSTEDQVCFEITANRFFHHMVRIILGTLLEVGYGKLVPEAIEGIIKSRNRTKAGQTIPPQGLFLVKVNYNKGLGE